jgi:hypothetical protein
MKNMGKFKKFGKPLKCKKQYRRRNESLSIVFPERLGRYQFGGFDMVYCRDTDKICPFRGKEKECKGYEIRKT